MSIFDLGSVGRVWIVVEGCLLSVDLHDFYYSGFGGTGSSNGFSEEEMFAFLVFVDESSFPYNVGWEGQVSGEGLDEGGVLGEEESEFLGRVGVVDSVVQLPQVEETVLKVQANHGCIFNRNRE